MIRNKRIVFTILLILFLIFLPNMVKATVSVTKEVYANNGSAKFNFTGLTLDKTHEYQFGFTKTAATEVKNWHLITEYTETTATINITAGTQEFTDVIVATNTGYITIKDKNTNAIVLQPYAVDLSIPYLNITNYTVISNGKDLDKNNIQVHFWNAGNSKAYYQYEKITDENVINKYKEIKSESGNYNDLQPFLKTSTPTSNWNTWGYWNGHGNSTTAGFGYTERSVNVPEQGLYYMWIYLAGNNIRNLYGYILVDNLQPEIALDSISLPKTEKVELGKTLTLTPTFSPETTTNKIVTWSSSDETVATVDNAGKVTPKKVGSTIITVTSQDGNKKATCTVTVTKSLEEIITRYVSFPFRIFNGKSSLSIKNYKGEYTLYYQFVEVNDEIMKKVEELKEQYEEKKISYSEFLENYEKLLPQYDEKNWIETKDGNFEIDLSKIEGTKKFALYAKLVMSDKTVYEAEIYTFDGKGTATNAPNEQDKLDNKDTTTAKTVLPKTGKVIFIWIALVLICSAIIANVRYKKLYK